MQKYHSNNEVRPQYDFEKLITSSKIYNRAVLDLNDFSFLSSKRRTIAYTIDDVNEALLNQDSGKLQEISEHYSVISGIYMRFIRYLAGIPTYSWFVYPELIGDKFNKNKVKNKTDEVMRFCDNLKIKSVFSNISQKVIKQGCFYGYLIIDKNKQGGDIFELPIDYCRTRYRINGLDAVEFNVEYFNQLRGTDKYKKEIIRSFPKEFQKAYREMDKIEIDPYTGGRWFLCDPNLSMKFSFDNEDIPIMVSVVPTLMELEEAKELDLKKTLQELLKIIVQKMPLTKDGDMLFDLDEAAAMHKNATQMLGNAINVDVLTTFADIDAIDLDNSTTSAQKDPLAKVERQVFNEAGISQMLFATDGNIALEKSILNDEALIFYLVRQYEDRLNRIINYLFNNNKFTIKIKIPDISSYNQEKKSKTYREMANSGYSKLMPAIATGYNQSEFISLINYENNVLNLTEKLIPVQTSYTQSGKATNADSGNKTGQVGAPKKDDDEKSEKTIQNLESLG